MYRLYVGANNRTKRVEINKIERFLNSRTDGYTIIPARGYWQGQREPSVVIEMQVTKRQAIVIATGLKGVLKQEAIGICKATALSFI